MVRINNRKRLVAGEFAGDIAVSIVTKKKRYCSKIDPVEDIGEDLAEDIVTKSLYYCSKTT